MLETVVKEWNSFPNTYLSSVFIEFVRFMKYAWNRNFRYLSPRERLWKNLRTIKIDAENKESLSRRTLSGVESVKLVTIILFGWQAV